MKIEDKTNLLLKNISGWETSVLERIGKRINRIGKMTLADVQKINNLAVTKAEMDSIIKDLAKITNLNISEIKRIYGETLEEADLQNKPLYDYRNVEFVPFAKNERLKSIVDAYSRTSAGEMLNLSNTLALGFVDKLGNFSDMATTIYNVIGKASFQIQTGAADFHTAMRDTVKQLGGSGVRVYYGSGVTRRLDTVVRQNLLWTSKQCYNEYNDYIGELLQTDGIEVDWHTNPRPSHEFMQGKQYSKTEEKIVKGVKYPSMFDTEQGNGISVYEALKDYGCLHFKTDIILGISVSSYSEEELKKLNEQNKKVFKIGNKSGNGYFWKEKMRNLETALRKTQETKVIAKASGDNALVDDCNLKIKALKAKYEQIANVTDIKAQPQRYSIIKGGK